jgi:dTDP-L-rhamnose 4-epimerase
LGREQIAPQITGKYRMGDIRNCFADISLARETLGYEPQVSLAAGLKELALWLEDQTAVDNFSRAQEELVKHGLSL